LRVYLVEDSTLLRARVIESISEKGHVDVIGHADTEDSALEGIRANDPDVVILDIQLRKGNGIRLLQRLSSLGLSKRPIVIILTNYDNLEYRRRAEAAGSGYFFDKRSEFHRVNEVLDSLAI
jgi:DNA-binding NarL/FixJ family response regulator